MKNLATVASRRAVLRGTAVAASRVLGVPAGSISSKCTSSLAPSDMAADGFYRAVSPGRNPAPTIRQLDRC